MRNYHFSTGNQTRKARSFSKVFPVEEDRHRKEIEAIAGKQKEDALGPCVTFFPFLSWTLVDGEVIGQISGVLEVVKN